jgi:hypothetical protein
LNDERGPRLIADHAIGNETMVTLKHDGSGPGVRTEDTINREGCTLRIEQVLNGPDAFACRTILLKRPKH